MKIDNGLIVDDSTSPPTCAGFIFNFNGHGSFAPSGKVKIGNLEVTDAQKDEHNRLLAVMEWTAMLKHGKGTLYLHKAFQVGDWPSVHLVPINHRKTSFHNFAGPNGRTDIWFTLDGSLWHGVNIGDNQIVKVQRTKGK